MSNARPDLLANLTDAQREAVTHFEGPLLVLAGAGSGKTRVITRRVAWLLSQGVRPGSILAITFTNKAAGEMRQRVEALVPGCRVWVSTFHAMGARLLRQYADRLNLDKNFTIYDQTDRAKLVKVALEDCGIDNVRFTPEGIQSAISKAKNQLLGPEAFARKAHDFFGQVVARVYPAYEKRLRDAHALDFDDLLYWPALAMKHDAELRSELDSRFRFVLIDEYQDTNHAQYQIARGLSTDNPNLCVVGDPDQCLPPGTLVNTPAGPQPVENIKDGEPVMTATGWGKTSAMPVDKVMRNWFKGRLVKVTLAGGRVIRATPNHIGFARLRVDPFLHFTYLMWKRGVGYRIGTTRGVRTSKDGEIVSGLQVRTNQEVADAMWILHTTYVPAEARFYEQMYSVRYGIPTMVFFVRGRQMEMRQDLIDRLYQEVDTEAGAMRLMQDLCLDRRYPHHRPGGVTRATRARRHVLFTVFGDPRQMTLRPWHEHRIQLVTSDQNLRVATTTRFRVRDGNRGTWRIETSRKNYDAGLTLAQDIGSLDPHMEVISRARLTPAKAFPFTPFSHIHPGMVVPVEKNGMVIECVVESVAWEDYEGPVYDLSVPETRNFIANGMVVHNSVYGWRGSDIRNILDFERDFPNTRVITLDRNYRSTKAILKAASTLIAHNVHRKPKDLITENAAGPPVTVLTFDSGQAEADGIAKRIKAAVAEGKRRFRDFAVFLRINALSRGLEQAFTLAQVPYQIVKGLAFYERKENRDVLAYLRLLLNPRDDLSFLRAVNEPARGIGKVSLEHLRQYAAPRELSLLEAAGELHKIALLKGKAAKGLRDFAQMMSDLRGELEKPPHEVIRAVLDRSGYRQMLKDSRDEDDEERLANIEELVTAAKQFAAEDESRTIADFLENVTLASDVDGWNEQQDCVSVMTLHAAKGLEFPVVFMAAVEQGLLPHERSLAKSMEVEEERRLCFVGMTRAKEELYLCHARLRDFRGSTLSAVPSTFLMELPADAVQTVDTSGASTRAANEWRGGSAAATAGWAEAGVTPPSKEGYTAGMLVRHEQYGVGRVTDLSGYGALRKVKIRFSGHGEKTFIADKVKLEVVRNQ